MIIILANLSEDMEEPQIKDIIESLKKDCQMEKISILAQKNHKTGIFEFHGLVTITPDSVAKNIIEELINNKTDNRYSDVHEYRERCDRRVNRNSEGLSGDHGSDHRNQYSEMFLKHAIFK